MKIIVLLVGLVLFGNHYVNPDKVVRITKAGKGTYIYFLYNGYVSERYVYVRENYHEVAKKLKKDTEKN